MANNTEGWHLSKSVPITFIATILLQTIVFVAFLSNMRSDVDHNIESIIGLQSDRDKKVDKAVNDQQLLVRDVHIDNLEDIVKENREILKEILAKIHTHDG